jgi:hypothetical protein
VRPLNLFRFSHAVLLGLGWLLSAVGRRLAARSAALPAGL